MKRTPQRLRLIGGGPGAMPAVRAHFKAALSDIPKERPLVAYVGVASDDNVGFRRMLTTELASSGARFEAAEIASPRASIPEARALLQECDLVFVSGGDVDHGMNVLAERALLEDFRSLCRQGKPMFGISAGSVMLAREWVRFPDDDEAKAEIFECIGAVPLHVDAHSEDDDWSELRTLLGLLSRRGEKGAIGYGLTVKGGLSVFVDEENVSLQAMGTDIPRFVIRSGEVISEAPLPCAAGGDASRGTAESHHGKNKKIKR
jgi:peptidase E